MVTAREIEEEVTGKDALSDADYAMYGRAISKGYATPYDAYQVGVRDGAEAALKAIEAEAEETDSADRDD